MTTDKATPRPWEAQKVAPISGVFILDNNGKPVASCHGYTKSVEVDRANAALIVKSVNLHDELVEALRESERAIDSAGKLIEFVHNVPPRLTRDYKDALNAWYGKYSAILQKVEE